MKNLLHIIILISLPLFVAANKPRVAIYPVKSDEITNSKLISGALDGVAAAFMISGFEVRNNMEWNNTINGATDAIYMEEEIKNILLAFNENNILTKKQKLKLKDLYSKNKAEHIAIVEIAHSPAKEETEYSIIIRLFEIKMLHYLTPPDHIYFNESQITNTNIIKDRVRLYLSNNGFSSASPLNRPDSLLLFKKKIELLARLSYLLPDDPIVINTIKSVSQNEKTHQLFFNARLELCDANLEPLLKGSKNANPALIKLWLDRSKKNCKELETISSSRKDKSGYRTLSKGYAQLKTDFSRNLKR